MNEIEKNEALYTTINSFISIILSNGGCEYYNEFSRKLKNHKNYEKNTLFEIKETLNILKIENINIYKRFYNRLIYLIKNDNLKGSIKKADYLSASSYSVFKRVRDFCLYIELIIEKNIKAEDVCEKYEKESEFSFLLEEKAI